MFSPKIWPTRGRGLRLVASWQVAKYGSIDDMQLLPRVAPSVVSPRDVLIRVHAASVNPLDTKMLEGYGATALGYLRCADSLSSWKSSPTPAAGSEPFPLTFGRDFSGTVQAVGKNVTRYKAGDEVWGIVAAHRQGSHSELTVTSDNCISRKPKNITHAQAASIPYAALTFWAMASTVAGLDATNSAGKRVLVTGGSGGLGTFGIQLLKAWGASVVTTVSTDATILAGQLGADYVIDYKTQDVCEELRVIGGVDIAVDCVDAAQAVECVKPGGTFVTCVHPVLAMVDRQGLAGTVSAAAALTSKAFQVFRKHAVHYRWAFVMPNSDALKQVCTLIEDGKVLPTIDKVFQFEKLPDAYRHVCEGRRRGKTVVRMVDD